jgi:hypothetical protein
MSGRSSNDSLRRLSPASDADAAAVFGVNGREELLEAVTGLQFGRRGLARRPTHRRRRLVLVVAALAVVAIGTAATWVVLRRAPAQETTSVECVIKGVDAIIPSSSGNPAADCAAEWLREEGTAAPPLRAYANGFGGVTVLPRSETPPTGYKRLQAQDAALIELQDSLDDVINGLNSACLDPAAATRLAKARLAELGFTGWTVGVRDPQSANTAGACTSMDVVDPAARTVTLIAAAGLSAGGTSLELAHKLRPITQSCESLPAAVASVRTAASTLGLSESARGYDLNTATDNSMRCASIYETVGGTIFLTVRGPKS